MSRRVLSGIAGLALLVSGCITSISVKKVGPDNPSPEGERIHLPASFLVGRYPSNFSTALSTNDVTNFDALATALGDDSSISKDLIKRSVPSLASDVAAYADLKIKSNSLPAELFPIIDGIALADLIQNVATVNANAIPKALLDPKTPPTTPAEKALMKRLLLMAAFPQTLNPAADKVTADSFSDLDGFIHQLALPTNSIAELAFSKLTGSAQTDVAAYMTDASKVQELHTFIVPALNSVINGPIIDAKLVTSRLAGLNPPGTLSRQTQDLKGSLAAQFTGPLPRLNRWLLYDAYTKSLASPVAYITYDIEMLPDPDEEYAISAQTYLAKQTVAIHRTPEGYLKELDLNQDSTAVAAAMVAGAGQYLQAKYSPSSSNNSPSRTSTTTTTTTTTGGGNTSGANNQGSNTQGGGNQGGSNNNQGNGNQSSKEQTVTQTTTVTSQPNAFSGPIAVVYRIVDSPLPRNTFEATLFNEDNLLDVSGLVDHLQKAPSPSFANDIFTLLTAQDPGYPSPVSSMKQQLDYMLKGLNCLLTNGLIYESKNFHTMQILLSEETKVLLTQYHQDKKSNPPRSSISRDPLLTFRINRSILEDVFPGMIAESTGLKLKLVDFKIFTYADGTNRMSPPAKTLTGLLQQTK